MDGSSVHIKEIVAEQKFMKFIWLLEALKVANNNNVCHSVNCCQISEMKIIQRYILTF